VSGVRPHPPGPPALVAALALVASCAPAGPDLAVREAWSRPTIAREGEARTAPAAPGVAYLTIVNRGRAGDRLLSVRSEVCSHPEIHETRIAGDRASMVHVEEGIEIPPRGRVELRPGGYHLMLIGLARHLREGETFEIVLEFERSGPIAVTADVRRP
jgi:copper(I)-binding protein